MRQALTAGIASLGMLGSGVALTQVHQGASRNGDAPAVLDSGRLGGANLSPITPRMLLDERSSVMREHEGLHRYFAEGPAPAPGQALTTLPQIRAQLAPLAESRLTRALRAYGTPDSVAPLVEFTQQASLYHAAQQISPQFVGSADNLAEAVAMGERSILFCEQLTSREFIKQAALALEDYHRAALLECRDLVAKQYPIESLTGYSLRTALLEVIHSNPARILPQMMEGKIGLYDNVDDLMQQGAPKAEAGLAIPLNLEALPPEVLMSVALKTGSLETNVAVAGSFVVNGSKDGGYLIIQRIWWRPANDPKAEPVLVAQRAMTDSARPEWEAVTGAVSALATRLKVETLSERNVEEGKGKVIERRKGYLHLQPWCNEKNEPAAALKAFTAQWDSGAHPGFAAESKLADGTTVLSEGPAPLAEVFNAWAVSLPAPASRQPIVDRNQQVLAAAECALAQEVRSLLCNSSPALGEYRSLLSVLDGTFAILGNQRSRSFAGIGRLLSPEAMRETLGEARELREVLCDLGERHRLTKAELERYRDAVHSEGDPINRKSIQDLRAVTANLNSTYREQLQGFGEFEQWAVRPRTLGPTDPRWMEQNEWERLRAITAQQPLAGEPYFALLDPRGDQPEELDGILGLRSGTSRLMMAVEASQILGREHRQSLLELRMLLNRMNPSNDEAITLVPVFDAGGAALGEFALEIGSIRERFAPEVEMLVKKGAARIILVDSGLLLPIDELKREAILEQELRANLLGDRNWVANGMRSLPTPSADMQRKLAKELPESPRSGKARLSAFLLLGQNAALQGVTVPLGPIDVAANALDSNALAETLRQEATAKGARPDIEPTPSQRLQARPGSVEVARRTPIVFLRPPEGNSMNIDALSDRAIASEIAEEVLRDEVQYQIRRILNGFFEGDDQGASAAGR